LDNVVTSTLVFEGEGRIAEYVGGYQDWLRQRSARAAAKAIEAKSTPEKAPAVAAPKAKKLSQKESRELDALPGLIENLENEQATLGARLADPSLYQKDAAEAPRIKSRLAEVEASLNQALARWEDLEKRRADSA
jgi:ABC transport system ATP-binding/permease protein